MRKFLSLFAAALVAVAVNADPVVLPATLDVNNVSFRSEGMPDFVLADGDYAGTYFDMGAHDAATDTLLYAEWDVTVEPIIYTVAADLYNTNGWSAHIELRDQNDQVLKVLRFTGSWGKSGQFAAGSLDLTDLDAGDYKLRARAATAWSKMKLKDLIFTANYAGVNVDLPGTLLPIYAELSSGASVANDAIVFNPETANNEYANWNVTFAEAGTYDVTIDFTASNGHTYGVELIGEDEETLIGSVFEEQSWDTGVKVLGSIEVPAAGNYIVHLTNATQWSEAVLNSITFAAPEVVLPYMAIIGDMNGWSGDELIPAEDKLTASVTINLEMNNNSGYGFKVLIGDKAYCIEPDGDWYAFHRGWTSASGIDHEATTEEAFWLQIDMAGDYTFTWTIAEKKLDITFPEIQHTYTVAGSSNDLFGTAWAASNAANDMTKLEDGTYKWEKANVTLAAGAVEFKVCQDHDWNPSYPAQNYVLNISESGIYTITITFNPEGNAVAAEATKTGDAVVVPTVALHGDFTKDGWKDTELFTIAEDKLTASLTLNLAADQYEFGMRIGGTGNWTANGATLTREANSTDLSVGSGNMKLIADVAGDYIFTYTYETNTLAVTFPTGTAIDNTAVDAQIIKTIENGQLIIIKNGVKFNAQGAVVR